MPSPAVSGAGDKFRSEFLPHRSALEPRVVDHRNLHLKLPTLRGLGQNTHNWQTCVWGGHAHCLSSHWQVEAFTLEPSREPGHLWEPELELPPPPWFGPCGPWPCSHKSPSRAGVGANSSWTLRLGPFCIGLSLFQLPWGPDGLFLAFSAFALFACTF